MNLGGDLIDMFPLGIVMAIMNSCCGLEAWELGFQLALGCRNAQSSNGFHEKATASPFSLRSREQARRPRDNRSLGSLVSYG